MAGVDVPAVDVVNAEIALKRRGKKFLFYVWLDLKDRLYSESK